VILPDPEEANKFAGEQAKRREKALAESIPDDVDQFGITTIGYAGQGMLLQLTDQAEQMLRVFRDKKRQELVLELLEHLGLLNNYMSTYEGQLCKSEELYTIMERLETLRSYVGEQLSSGPSGLVKGAKRKDELSRHVGYLIRDMATVVPDTFEDQFGRSMLAKSTRRIIAQHKQKTLA
jgi:hypothetical protein